MGNPSFLLLIIGILYITSYFLEYLICICFSSLFTQLSILFFFKFSLFSEDIH